MQCDLSSSKEIAGIVSTGILSLTSRLLFINYLFTMFISESSWFLGPSLLPFPDGWAFLDWRRCFLANKPPDFVDWLLAGAEELASPVVLLLAGNTADAGTVEFDFLRTITAK